jgi:hypothetical protein
MDNGVDDGDVARLMEYGCTADQAHFLLEACAGNFNRALSMYRGKHSFSQLGKQPFFSRKPALRSAYPK